MPFLILETNHENSERCEKLCIRITTQHITHKPATFNALAATDYLCQQQTRVWQPERERKREIEIEEYFHLQPPDSANCSSILKSSQSL
jgi:hypothetical protein